MNANPWVKPAGSTADAEYDVAIRPGDPGWAHTGLLVANLTAGQTRQIDTGDCEYIVLPLSGAIDVEVDGRIIELAGRPNVFAAASDLVYVPRGRNVTVRARTDGRFAFPHARAASDQQVSVLAAAEVPKELRGAGRASRQVRNFGTPGTLPADSIIACEVLTPAGNWSSYPPHKHDVDRPGQEAELEEIYYFEMAVDRRYARPGQLGAHAQRPIGHQRVYGTDERPIHVDTEVRSGDTVLVPHGWHGPSMAPPGYDMYYLNVMAGPGAAREWLICDDPAHAWIRDTWPLEAVDERLPFDS